MKSRNTINSQYGPRTVAGLLCSVVMFLSALAQTGNQPSAALVAQLQCNLAPGSNVALTLTNTSGLTVPAHKPIFIVTDAGKAAVSFPEPFAPKTSRRATGPPGPASTACQAYFYK